MKTMKVLCVVASLALVVCLGATPAAATLITSLPGGTVVPMQNLYNSPDAGPGTHTFPGGAITYTTTATPAYYGYSGAWNFGTNGGWDDATKPMASMNPMGTSATITFNLTSAVSAIGGFLNYDPTGTATIAAYSGANGTGTLLGTYALNFATGGGSNTGYFFGFQDGTADIASFTLTTTSQAAIRDITVPGSAPVPLPGALLLFGPGLLGLMAVRRRFKK